MILPFQGRLGATKYFPVTTVAWHAAIQNLELGNRALTDIIAAGEFGEGCALRASPASLGLLGRALFLKHSAAERARLIGVPCWVRELDDDDA